MSRYASRPQAKTRASDWWDEGPLLPSLTVDSHVEVDTGLVDARGHPIYRLPEPMGFHRREP